MRLGAVLAGFRKANRIGTRELAKSIGISNATLNRIERGHPCKSDQLALIMTWPGFKGAQRTAATFLQRKCWMI